MTRRSRTHRSVADLADAGLLRPEAVAAVAAVGDRYAVAVTPAMAALVDPTDAADPIARQFVPDVAELTVAAGENADPIGDGAYEVTPGLIHRYPDRALLKLTSVCAVYCRFCFRREMVGPGEGTMTRADIDSALAHIRAHPDIWEVVVSGGDPLVVGARRLAMLTTALNAIDHLKVVRFHTRVPVVVPEQISDDLVAAMKTASKATWVAIHANHPRELTPAARAALARMSSGGLFLVSQTVLLRGVNDDAETLAALMRAFVESGVKPYYLHHADLAPGTAHFRTSIAKGQALVRTLRGRLSGLCQPAYVLDIPGGHGKVPVGPGYVSHREGACLVEDFRGARHAYPE
jgi:lysine 2,3-aminomutase